MLEFWHGSDLKGFLNQYYFNVKKSEKKPSKSIYCLTCDLLKFSFLLSMINFIDTGTELHILRLKLFHTFRKFLSALKDMLSY